MHNAIKNINMRSLILSLFALVTFSSSSFAQQQAKIVIKVPQLNCDACKDRLETYLSREDGVESANADINHKTVTIVYLTERTSPDDLRVAIANAGFDADTETAEPDAYNKLPPCCKKQASK